ncbi:MAG: type II secretion system protein [Acholeplasma sp.]|nr:type II secretion system protein [Acholeplasma sp.]
MKNKKKKGFTLIELLAVIVVLSIIALITTPIIFNVIENAKIKSIEKSCYGVIDAVRTKYAEGLLNLNKITTGDVNELTVAGEKPIAGTWTIYNSKDSVEKGIKIEGVKFASMKDYVCTNVNSDGTINSNVTCTKENDVSSEPILKEKLLGTNDSNVVTSGDGLYSKTTSTGTTYYFKGAVENNYVKFADKVWRIVRINEDGTMRLITQDNVISSQKFNSAYNTYDKMYYTNSEIKTAVENWYKTNISDKGFDEKVVNGNYFCEQAKVVYNTNYTAGSATVATKDNYTPSFDCTTDGNGKGVVSGKVGLITIDEVLFAGGVIGSSSNFYLKNGSAYCMMSPAGFYTYNDYARAWGVVSAGRIGDFHVASNYGVRPVINLSADTLVTGSGTSSDPYVVKS